MLILNHKAVYSLLEKFYQRRSLNQLIFSDTPENIFEASKVTATALEDYEFLDSMVSKRDSLDKKFSLFIDGYDFGKSPIILVKEKDLTILELAILSRACTRINVKLFHEVIEAQAENNNVDAKTCIGYFDGILQHILKKKKAAKKKSTKKTSPKKSSK